MKWFQTSLVSPGNIIKLHKEWRVLHQVGQHDFQADASDLDLGASSYATIQLECQSGSTVAYMRIYMQVPIVDTEFASYNERAQEATTIDPMELKALGDLTTKQSKYAPRLIDFGIQQQDSSALVPGGALVFVVWEIVPGVRLGDSLGADAFGH
ncbi:hypothetical protein N7540_011457 [Penicillium herquei]|nr:hypothetical protein N7540_011457 [Penicillium herquei]